METLNKKEMIRNNRMQEIERLMLLGKKRSQMRMKLKMSVWEGTVKRLFKSPVIIFNELE